MVGVSYMIIIIFNYLTGFLYCIDDNCPRKCNCLGDYVLCADRNFSHIPAIPNWTGRLNLNSNQIRTIDGNAWQNVSKLTELRLNRNKINKLNNDSLLNQTSLILLELSRNQLQTVIPLTFKHLNRLSTLKLKRNKISKLEDGALFGLSSIKSLKLDYNRIQTISKKWLYGLNTLQDLSLSHNKINEIEQGAWEFCTLLINLDLSRNNLAAIKRDTFNHLSLLQRLSLNDNSISYIEDGAFGNTPDLRTLQLSKNKISFIIEDSSGIFKKLNKLNKFYLAANDIKSINKNAFIGLNNVMMLDLSRNNITSIQKNAFADMPLLQVLELNTTSLLCDCNIKWFYDWLKSRKLNISTICAHPEGLRNQSLLMIDPHNFTCGDLVKPRLIVEPEPEIMALKNANISLSCRAMSNSPSEMKVHWKKDNKEIINANITNSTNNESKSQEIVSVLNIYNVQHTDAGVYQCIVSNSFGATYSQKANISVLIFPVFVKEPKNVTVPSGTTVRLECSADGEPPPQISWQKDGGNDFPSARERRIHVMHSDDVIFIVNAKPVDMGVYTCTAGNPAGKISANATLTIEEKPYFGKPMENQVITAGESVVFQCMAGGAPKPTVQWLKDGEPIHATERHFFTAEEQLMIIVDTVSSDEGTYQCQLNNSFGIVTGYSELQVKSAPTTQSENMGIIIITVVCCAVLTSTVWVTIIYQAKKKRINRAHVGKIPEPDIPQLDFTEKPVSQFSDDISEHSSCKDSGTGDSAKRSNDDLLPSDEYAVIIKDMGPVTDPQSTMRTASLLCLSNEKNNSQTPLLYSDRVFVRSTNHDRLQETNVLKNDENNIENSTHD